VDGPSIGIGDTSTEQLATEIGLIDEEIAWRKEFVGVSDEDAIRQIVSGYFDMLTGGQYDREYFNHRTRIGGLHDQLDMQVVNDTYLHSYSKDLHAEIERSREMREEIADSIDEVQTEAASVTKRMTKVDRLVEEQSERTTDPSGEIADLSATIEEIAATTDDVASTSERAREAAADGDDAATKAMGAMERVEAKQDDIGNDVEELVDAIDEVEGIVEVINGIADQTNILALNASIEAATGPTAAVGPTDRASRRSCATLSPTGCPTP